MIKSYKESELPHLNIAPIRRTGIYSMCKKLNIELEPVTFRTAKGSGYTYTTFVITNEILDEILEKSNYMTTRVFKRRKIVIETVRSSLNGELYDGEKFEAIGPYVLKKKSSTNLIAAAEELGKYDDFFYLMRTQVPKQFRYLKLIGKGNLADGYKKYEKIFFENVDKIMTKDMDFSIRRRFAQYLSANDEKQRKVETFLSMLERLDNVIKPSWKQFQTSRQVVRDIL